MQPIFSHRKRDCGMPKVLRVSQGGVRLNRGNEQGEKTIYTLNDNYTEICV